MATEIIEADRAALAHEIHDSLMPILFAASAGLGRLRSDTAPATTESAARLETVVGWIEDAQAVSRQILTGVHPPGFDGGDWIAPARDTVERLFADDVDKFQWSMDPSAEECDAGVAIVCYRIVVEAVRNAMRHANATQIEIDARRRDGDLVVTISDDGAGFNPDAIPQNHFGVRAMRGRAKLIGGTLAIDSRIGGPTRVTLSV